MASILGSVSGPQNGGRFVGKILVTGRKIARVSIVSARTRQKFSMPLLFHGFVLHTLRTFMATHVLELFKNMCGHKRSQGVENNCSRRCKTMGTQWRSGMRNFCRVPAETIETCTIFRPAAKILPTNGTRFGVRFWTPKRGPSRPDTSKSN